MANGANAPLKSYDVKIDSRLSVGVCGTVGLDETGRFVLPELQMNGVNVDRVVSLPNTATSFSDVMSLPNCERTFFHKNGTNAQLSQKHIDIKNPSRDISHIGYILLLNRLDAEEIRGSGNAGARAPARAQ